MYLFMKGRGCEMKIRIENKQKGMYRVVLGIGNRYSCCLSTDQEHCDEEGNIRAVGFWHRHDEEDLEDKLSDEAGLLLNAYSRMTDYSGAIVGTEWKGYRS